MTEAEMVAALRNRGWVCQKPAERLRSPFEIVVLTVVVTLIWVCGGWTIASALIMQRQISAVNEMAVNQLAQAEMQWMAMQRAHP